MGINPTKDSSTSMQAAAPFCSQWHPSTVSGTLPQVAVPSSQVAVPFLQVTAPLRLPTDGGTLITGHCILQAGSDTLKCTNDTAKDGTQPSDQSTAGRDGTATNLLLQSGQETRYDRLGLRPHK